MTTLIVALVSSTLFFLLGVMVGREYAIREGIATVKENVRASPLKLSPGAREGPETKEGKGQDKVNITFYDQLMKEGDQELNREIVKKEAKRGKKRPGPVANGPEKTGKKTKGKEAAAPRKVVPVSSGDYALQVAAFRDRNRALKMVQMLGRQGFKAHIMRVLLPGKGGVFYRVWVGYYRNLSEAARARRILLQQDTVKIPKATIVKR